MIRTGESPVTQPALEGSVTSVLTIMASELVAAREFPPTPFPATNVRLLSGMRSQMGLEVWRLRVRFLATGVLTHVRGESFLSPRRFPCANVAVFGDSVASFASFLRATLVVLRVEALLKLVDHGRVALDGRRWQAWRGGRLWLILARLVNTLVVRCLVSSLAFTGRRGSSRRPEVTQLFL